MVVALTALLARECPRRFCVTNNWWKIWCDLTSIFRWATKQRRLAGAECRQSAKTKSICNQSAPKAKRAKNPKRPLGRGREVRLRRLWRGQGRRRQGANSGRQPPSKRGSSRRKSWNRNAWHYSRNCRRATTIELTVNHRTLAVFIALLLRFLTTIILLVKNENHQWIE